MKYGQNAVMALGLQSVTETNPLVLPALYWLPLLSESIAVERPPLLEQNLRGVFEEGMAHAGPLTISGELEVEASPAIIATLLRAIFGNPSSSRGRSNTNYTHTFTPRKQDYSERFANHPLTIYKHFYGDPKASVFYNMVASSLDLNIANGEFLKLKLGLLGGNVAEIDPVTTTYDTNKPLNWQQTSCRIENSSYGEFTQLNIQINENLEAVHTLDGNESPSRIQRSGFRTISLQGSSRLGNISEYQAFLNQEERSFQLAFESDVTLSGGIKESATISIPKFRYVELKPTISGPGALETEFSAKAIRTQSTDALSFTLVNNKIYPAI